MQDKDNVCFIRINHVNMHRVFADSESVIKKRTCPVKKKLILQCQTDFLFEQLFFYYTPNS